MHFTRLLCLQGLRHGRSPFFPNFVFQSKGAEADSWQGLQIAMSKEQERKEYNAPLSLLAIFRKRGKEDSFDTALLPGLPSTTSTSWNCG